MSVPLLGTAMIYGSIPLVDISLGFVLPLHCHIGFDCIIQDYLPARKTKILNVIATWLLRIATGLTMYGCYVINSQDIGITGVVARLWTGKTEKK